MMMIGLLDLSVLFHVFIININEYSCAELVLRSILIINPSHAVSQPRGDVKIKKDSEGGGLTLNGAKLLPLFIS